MALCLKYRPARVTELDGVPLVWDHPVDNLLNRLSGWNVHDTGHVLEVIGLLGHEEVGRGELFTILVRTRVHAAEFGGINKPSRAG